MGEINRVRKPVTTLAELLDDIDNLDEEAVIYVAVEPELNCCSLAVAALEPADGSLPSEAAGMTYLLEAAIAKEVLNVWQEWREGKRPSSREKCEAVIYYAKNDSYLPVRH